MQANCRSIVTETIMITFVIVHGDVNNPGLPTSMITEHVFSRCRKEKREATVLECSGIEEKRARKVDAIYRRKLSVPRDLQSSYGASCENFVNSGLAKHGILAKQPGRGDT